MRIKSLVKGLSAVLVTLLGGVAVAQHSTGTYTQVVNAATGTISIASSVNPSSFGQSVTFTATMPLGATGTVTFYSDGTAINTAAAVTAGTSSATAATSTTSLAVGNHNITATFTANSSTSNYGNASTGTTPTTGSITQVVNAATSTITLASSPNSSTYGQSVTFTAAGLASGATGNIIFYDQSTSTALGTVAVTSGGATFSISTLTVGTHNVVAQYGGDTNYAAANSAVDPQVVKQASTTSDVLKSSTNPSVYGTSVTFTATMPANATGTVTFQDAGVTIGGPVTLAGGIATFSTSSLAVSASPGHPITAVYSGDTNYAGTTSNTVGQVVTQQSGETVGLTSSLNPSTFGTSVTFTATVPSTATGTVTFKNGSTAICTAQAITAGTTSSTATCTTSSLPVGTDSITAVYSGDSNYATATSTALSQTVNIVGATVAISGAPNASTYGANVVMTITVTGVNSVSPTGSVTLTDSITGSAVPVPPGTAITLTPGTGASAGTSTATFSISTLAAGSHPITATYSGDANYK